MNKNIHLKSDDLKTLIKQEELLRERTFSREREDESCYSSVDNYINRIKPRINENSCEKKQLRIYEYHQVVTLGEGDKFGDYAFGSFSRKRMGTVITLDNCDFATLNKDNYDFLLNDAVQKIKNMNIKWLLNETIFEDIDRTVFERKYYNYFVKFKINHNEILVKEGELLDHIFFIKSSSFIIESKLSLIGARSLIEYYGGKENYYREGENSIILLIKIMPFLIF